MLFIKGTLLGTVCGHNPCTLKKAKLFNEIESGCGLFVEVLVGLASPLVESTLEIEVFGWFSSVEGDEDDSLLK